jgi:hypothetical protein
LNDLAIGDDAWVLPNGAIYCSRHCAKEAESEAKCLLVDAAPALLEACKALLRHVEGRNAGLDETRLFAAAKALARNAIALAETNEM